MEAIALTIGLMVNHHRPKNTSAPIHTRNDSATVSMVMNPSCMSKTPSGVIANRNGKSRYQKIDRNSTTPISPSVKPTVADKISHNRSRHRAGSPAQRCKRPSQPSPSVDL